MTTASKYLPIDKLRLWDKNPRSITRDAYNSLKNKIQRWGQFKPVICTPDGEVIGGNMRLRAYQELGIKDIWVSIVKPKNEAEKLEIAITDNEASGRWQEEQLAEYLEQYKGEIDLGNYQVDLGNPVSLDELLSKYGPEPEEDEVPGVQEEAVSKLGEVYQLGRHRVMCGSAVEIDDVNTLLGDTRIDIVFTDPPYGIDVVKNDMVGADFGIANKGKYTPVINDETTQTAQEAYNIYKALNIPKIILWGGNYFLDFLPASDGWLIWDKRGDSGIKNTFADGEMAWCNFHTPIRIYTQLWNGMIREGEHDKRVHPTQKPTKTISQIIKDYSSDSNTILDNFLGSGSTLIACEQTNRICYGCELDNKYVDVIIKRWMKFTGKRAYKIIDADGNQCNIPVKFADESFMEQKTLQEDLEVQK